MGCIIETETNTHLFDLKGGYLNEKNCFNEIWTIRRLPNEKI